MECLCIMHEAKPYGHLLLNGNPVGDDALARMTGAAVDEVSVLMAELRKAGVFSVTREGIIFSRRMTMDHALASKGRKAARKRWAQNDDFKAKSDEPNRVPNREPFTQKPETRNQNRDANASQSKEIEREFDEEFWPAYPRKAGKGQALKAYRTARKRAGLDAIISGVRRYAAERVGQDQQYTRHAATWLNGVGWEDEPAPSARPMGQAPPRQRTMNDAIDDFIRSNTNGPADSTTIEHDERDYAPNVHLIAAPSWR